MVIDQNAWDESNREEWNELVAAFVLAWSHCTRMKDLVDLLYTHEEVAEYATFERSDLVGLKGIRLPNGATQFQMHHGVFSANTVPPRGWDTESNRWVIEFDLVQPLSQKDITDSWWTPRLSIPTLSWIAT